MEVEHQHQHNHQQSTDDWKDIRLPQYVVPSRYSLSLSLADTFSQQSGVTHDFPFYGHVDIDVKVHEQTSLFVLHSLDLKFAASDVAILKHDKTYLFHATQVKFDNEKQQVHIHWPTQLSPDHYIISIDYLGHLNDKMCGFYRSAYTSIDGTSKFMAVTQFEATDARRALPCWDEPAFKAVFDVTLVVPVGLEAVSNMPAVSVSYISKQDEIESANLRRRGVRVGLRKFIYSSSPIMSTYLLAFIVGEFDYIMGYTADKKVQVRIYTPVGLVHQAQFALEVASNALTFYNQFFGIEFPLPKVDLLAIPDFAAGAMENWGAITYRQTRLLIDTKNSALSAKFATARTICHELAHMWFGNLVTMKWWTSLWLNEGFARYMEFVCVDHIFPNWNIWLEFVDSVYKDALRLDALLTSHAIEVEVNHPSEINEIFDSISYAKGASMIRMLCSYIGFDNFSRGLQIYLTKHQYDNTITSDLWHSLSHALQSSTTDHTQMSITDLMTPWIKQVGFPLITVEPDTTTSSGETLSLVFNQKQFFSNPQMKGQSLQLWPVPITVTVYTSNGPTLSNTHSTISKHPVYHQTNFILSQPEQRIELRVPADGHWFIKINNNHTSFFRTVYSDSLLQRLIPNINGLSVADRLGVLSDAYECLKAGVMDLSQAMNLMYAYRIETDLMVISSLSTNIANLYGVHGSEAYKPQLQKFILALFAPLYEKYGWNNSAADEECLGRSVAIKMMVRANYQPAIHHTLSAFDRFCQGNLHIPGDMRSTVYDLAVSEGDEKNWNQIKRLYEQSTLAEERVRAMSALGHTSDSKLIQKTLEWALSDEVRDQDKVYVLSGVCSTNNGRQLTWQYFQNNWSLINEKYGKGTGFILSRLVSAIISGFKSKEKMQEISDFFQQNPCPPAARTIRQCLEQIDSNANRLDRERNALAVWLAATSV